MTSKLPILAIAKPSAWEDWLQQHSATSQGVWLKIAKKNSSLPGPTYEQALDLALCYGWIDGQRKSLDENYFLQRFTPRQAHSLWSKRNSKKVEALMAAGKLQPSGIAEINKAKADGRWPSKI